MSLELNIRKDIWNAYKKNYVHPEFAAYALNPLKTTPKGLHFRRMNTDDPCPAGFLSVGNEGMCYQPPLKPFESKYSPTVIQTSTFPYKSLPTFTSQFDMRSVNPYTGKYTTYYSSKPSNNSNNYKSQNFKNSYVA